MSIENEETLKVYDKKAELYIKTGLIHDSLEPEKAKKKKCELEDRIRETFKSIPRDGKILEIGSANGANAKYHMGLDRYYHYFKESDISKIAIEARYEIEEISKEGGEENNKWLIYILKKVNHYDINMCKIVYVQKIKFFIRMTEN